MINRFTPKAQAAISTAKKWAEKMGHSYIGSEHLLLGILGCDSVGKKLLEDKNVLFDSVYKQLLDIAGAGKENSAYAREMTPRCKKILEESSKYARRFETNLIGTEHLLYALCDDGESVGGRILSSLGINLQGMKNEISSLLEGSIKGTKKEHCALPGAPLLSAYGKSLTSSAKKGHLDPLIGRDKEVERLVQVLCRRTKNNPCLIGEPGVGKTAIVEGLAQRICEGNVPTELSGKDLIALDLPAMVAGAKYRGEFEERMKGVLNELGANPSIILFIDEVHTIMGAGAAEGAVDAANILKPALARGQLQLIGATTFEEYRRYIEKDTALERRFQPIAVLEPSRDEAYEMLIGLKESYEKFHRVKIPDEVIYHAVKLSSRYITDRFLPDKAIDVIDEACSRVKTALSSSAVRAITKEISTVAKKREGAILESRFDYAKELGQNEESLYKSLEKAQKKAGRDDTFPVLSESDVEDVVAQWSRVPISKDATHSAGTSFEERLSRRIVGQDEAVAQVANLLKRGCAGLKSPHKPIGSFLFVGPTGVGKTELAKAIAESVFGSESCLIRLDMSEYAEKHSVSRLVGSPPGYVGYEDGGVLTKAIRKMPHSVVLFDEIEKAHPDIYNLLLQILDYGSLTDTSGRHSDFQNSVIVLTSNVGATEKAPLSLGFGSAVASDELQKNAHLEAVKLAFKPELLNRLDKTVVFKELSQRDLTKIASLMLDEVKELSRQIGINLSFSHDVADLVVEKGFERGRGARPIRRAITNLVETPLSEKILSLSIKKGDDVSVFCENGTVTFKALNPV